MQSLDTKSIDDAVGHILAEKQREFDSFKVATLYIAGLVKQEPEKYRGAFAGGLYDCSPRGLIFSALSVILEVQNNMSSSFTDNSIPKDHPSIKLGWATVARNSDRRPRYFLEPTDLGKQVLKGYREAAYGAPNEAKPVPAGAHATAQ